MSLDSGLDRKFSLCAIILAFLSGASSMVFAQEEVLFADGFEPTFTDCADCPTMVMIPAGSFTQGSPPDEPERRSNEGPQRIVNVPAFAMGQTEVTFAQWDACVADGGCSHDPSDSGWGRSDRPVINVSWDDAQEYVTWLSNTTGYDYRLPSESEWEYATRAGTTGRFNTGDCITTDQANFDGLEPAQDCPVGVDRQQTLQVASFAPNAFGLYDTHGNVWEWVEDCWNPDYIGAPTDGSAWRTGDCSRTLLRGGSWVIFGRNLRSAYRGWSTGGFSFSGTGFRVARSVSPPTFIDCADCPTMVMIPAGSFTQGSPPDEPERQSNEGPQRTVNVPAFAMGQTEVTFDQWDACVADGGCSHDPSDSGWGRSDRPVIKVSWDDAQEYVTWLSNTTGYDYRLPSESEWEYATRAGTTGRFNTGDCITTDQANFSGDLPPQGCPTGTDRNQTMPVASFGPNAFGLYDTHGNVWEWVQDCWNGSYIGAPTDGSAWMTGDCSRPVLRGGAFSFFGQALRSARRTWFSRGRRFDFLGFRVVRALTPNTTFSDCADCPTMVQIPAGTFVQGSPPDEPERASYEGPQRTVNVSAFALGQTEVTFAQWDACVADGGCSHDPSDSGWGRSDRPVINVSWDDAQEYITWLSNKTGQNYRLPSESEWEYATRAGTAGRFNTGDCITTDQANFWGGSPAQGCPTGVVRSQTVPVASFAPNGFGLHDTHGNVWEWVQDCWNTDFIGAPTNGNAWMTGECSRAVLRSGSWVNVGSNLRSASRNTTDRGFRVNYFGFRVARSVSL